MIMWLEEIIEYLAFWAIKCTYMPNWIDSSTLPLCHRNILRVDGEETLWSVNPDKKNSGVTGTSIVLNATSGYDAVRDGREFPLN